MNWDEGIEGPALRIAATTNSPLCVVAGPGTGKTFALMRRLARLLQVDGQEPRRVLACTFTRTAAEDITRAVANLGVEGAENVVTQTVHGFCFSMLMREDVLLVTGRTPRPLLRFEERFLLQDLARARLGGVRECGKTLRAFSAAWARLQHEDPGWPHDDDDRRFQAALLAWLRFHRAMLIGELIPEAIRYLRGNPESPYRDRFDHVLVDEYQDLNRAEQALVDLIAGTYLVVIGDEDQSIYSFKHAHPEGIVEFPGTHPDTEEASLLECRRCPRRVVALANSLIQNNASRSVRELTPMPANPEGEVLVVQWRSMQQEAEGLAALIKARTDSGDVIPGNVLVLAPRREFGYLIRDALRELGVSAYSFFSEQLLDGDPKSVDDSKAQQTLALLTLLGERGDRVALRCWCGFGNNSLADGAWARLREHCEHSGESPWDALEKLVDGTLTLPYTTYIVDRFRLLQREIERLTDVRGEKLVEAVFPSDEEWAAPLADLANDIEEEDFGAVELADAVRRNVSQPELPTNVDYVRVMSLHKSKGLTADLVVVCGCLEGLIPTVDDDLVPEEQARALEEQRRLFYVAITRTRRTLVLSSVSRIPTRDAYRMRARSGGQVGSNTRTLASRFIHELGPECPAAMTAEEFLALLERIDS